MIHIGTEKLFIYLAVTFVTAFLSGIAGGGAGFINTPLLIFLGLSPAQAVATGKVTGLSTSIASLTGMRKVLKGSKKERVIIVILAFAIGLLAPFVIKNLNADTYRQLLGALLILMIPIMFLQRKASGSTASTPQRRFKGYGLLAGALALQAVFSAGMGTLVNIVLMTMFGMAALEASALKRYSQLVLNLMIVVGVLFAHLIVWQIALFGIGSSAIGAYLGSKFALKKGDEFVVWVLIGLMLVSGLWLLIS